MTENKYVVATETSLPHQEARVLYLHQVAISQSRAVATAATATVVVTAFEFWLKHLYLRAEPSCNRQEPFQRFVGDAVVIDVAEVRGCLRGKKGEGESDIVVRYQQGMETMLFKNV